MRFNIQPEIYFGKNALENLKNLHLDRVMIASDPFLIDNGMISLITDILDEVKVEYTIFSDIVPDTPLSKVMEGIKVIDEFKPSAIIAVGGGSAIDTSKAIKFFNNKIDKSEKDIKLIAIPTTSGTGSEVTRHAVVLDEETNMKHALTFEELLPEIAILDVELVKSVPNKIAVETGMDVLVHGIESYVANDSNDMTDMIALKAIKDVFEYLPKVVEDNDLEAREKMHLASCLAGIAFENAGLGINHSLAHALGGKYRVPHGKVNAILIPYIIRYNGERMKENKYLKLADELGVEGFAPNIKFGNLIRKIENLKKRLGVPESLSNMKDIEIDEGSYMNSLDEMAKIALNDSNTPGNPVKTDIEDLKRLLVTAYGGKNNRF